MSGAVALLALGRLVWCAIATARTLRRVLRAARSSHARTFDYLVLPDSEEPASAPSMLLLFEPGADRPTAVMYVRPGVLRVPPRGVADLREAAGSPWAVAYVDGRPVWPFSPLIDLVEGKDAEDFREYVAYLLPPAVTLTSPVAGE